MRSWVMLDMVKVKLVSRGCWFECYETRIGLFFCSFFYDDTTLIVIVIAICSGFVGAPWLCWCAVAFLAYRGLYVMTGRNRNYQLSSYCGKKKKVECNV